MADFEKSKALSSVFPLSEVEVPAFCSHYGRLERGCAQKLRRDSLRWKCLHFVPITAGWRGVAPRSCGAAL
ncbi:hypothetical protein JTE90_000874 [Oedothorax gibbosus]|uniref:Uncharacterized protein n=1 Tax=Oedothorax gibbosus TaxID=931172 RepID=A0AAV6VWD1_9ARAC|nr:hypothetical protein JTE90_000874 [Oedothorax gibbosus]